MSLLRLLGGTLVLLAAASCANGQGASQDGGVPSDGSSIVDSGAGDSRTTCDACADAKPDAPATPKLNPKFPPYNLTWTPTGDLGRAGGLTWTYTGINRTGVTHIDWIVCDDPNDPCGLSLDGPIDVPGEKWAFSATDSDLPNGKLVFTNTTGILLADSSTTPLSGRLTVTIVDASSAPIPFATVASLGVTARDGQYGAEIKGTGFKVTALAEVEDTKTSTWTPYLDYYDAATTPDTGDAGGNAYVSFGGYFYDD